MQVDWIGLLILAVGTTVVFLSGSIAGLFKRVKDEERISIIIKVIGFIIAAAGALLAMNVI